MRRPFAAALMLAPLALLAGPGLDAKPRPARAAAVDPALAEVLAHPRRDADRPRDAARQPAGTLAFFRVAPGMTVVDFMPATGWYTRILLPYLGEQGRYIGLNPDVRTASDGVKRNNAGLAASLPGKAAEWTGIPAERINAFNSDGLPPALNSTVDRVLIFREIHNLHRFDLLRRELATIRGLLKADGLLGIEQHRAKPDASASYTDGSKGYLRERDVIALIEANGFELVARSEINANPRDPANHPDGVWMLPPVFRQGDTDRARYAEIGESDRMTLLFRKRP